VVAVVATAVGRRRPWFPQAGGGWYPLAGHDIGRLSQTVDTWVGVGPSRPGGRTPTWNS